MRVHHSLVIEERKVRMRAGNHSSAFLTSLTQAIRTWSGNLLSLWVSVETLTSCWGEQVHTGWIDVDLNRIADSWELAWVDANSCHLVLIRHGSLSFFFILWHGCPAAAWPGTQKFLFSL